VFLIDRLTADDEFKAHMFFPHRIPNMSWSPPGKYPKNGSCEFLQIHSVLLQYGDQSRLTHIPSLYDSFLNLNTPGLEESGII